MGSVKGWNNGARVSQIQWFSAISQGVYTRRHLRDICSNCDAVRLAAARSRLGPRVETCGPERHAPTLAPFVVAPWRPRCRRITAPANPCPGGEIGRRKGLKIPRRRLRAGSSPAPGSS
jgi:hypothetical protein